MKWSKLKHWILFLCDKYIFKKYQRYYFNSPIVNRYRIFCFVLFWNKMWLLIFIITPVLVLWLNLYFKTEYFNMSCEFWCALKEKPFFILCGISQLKLRDISYPTTLQRVNSYLSTCLKHFCLLYAPLYHNCKNLAIFCTTKVL